MQSSTESPFIVCDNLVKIYKVADLEVVALQGLDLEVAAGEMMAIVGVSGSGKSTLLNVIGGLDVPSAGKVEVGGYDLLSMDRRRRVRYKREMVGFVWQQPGRNLMPYLSARENVELPMTLARGAARRRRALDLLEMLGLTDRAEFRPERLSGGEQQLVALGVALANHPPLLLADELTGQLDSHAANSVFDALHSLNRELNTTIVIVTHDPQVVARVDRVVGIRDGRTSTELRRETDHRGYRTGDGREEEWVILDRAGRLQLPQEYVDELAMRGRVKVRLEPDHVSVWPSFGLERAGESGVARATAAARLTVQAGAEQPVGAQEPGENRRWAVETRDLWRTFDVTGPRMAPIQVHALQGVSMQVPAGVLAVVQGRSGAGKTTLLNLVGGLDEPTRGTVLLDGRDLVGMKARERIELRRRHVGFVFQSFGLLPFMTARENVEAPLRLLLALRRERRERTDELLALVGLSERAQHRTHELSGGEQQRVAIARALVARPSLILADEPTGQLDTVTGVNIVALLREIVLVTGATVLVASHDPRVREAADVVYELHDGSLVGNSSEEESRV
jgi:peptide/nickel transport system ATP-binding protein